MRRGCKWAAYNEDLCNLLLERVDGAIAVLPEARFNLWRRGRFELCAVTFVGWRPETVWGSGRERLEVILDDVWDVSANVDELESSEGKDSIKVLIVPGGAFLNVSEESEVLTLAFLGGYGCGCG